MRILVVLEVDMEKLAGTGLSFQKEIGLLEESGITLNSYAEAEEHSIYEYAAFVWNTDTEEYIQIGRAVMTEQLCRNRFQELADDDALDPCYDTGCVETKRRVVSEFYGEWEKL